MNDLLQAINAIGGEDPPYVQAHTLNVYVGTHGDYVIPAEVMAAARRMNAGKSLDDRRTKGARHIAWWGRCQDSDAEAVLLLSKRAQH